MSSPPLMIRVLGLVGFVFAVGALSVLTAASAQASGNANTPTVPSPGDWQQLVKLISGRGGATEFFGSSVGISGDTVVVSSATNYVNAIAGFVFAKSTQGWADTLPVAGLRLPSPVDRLFTYVAIDGDTIVIGTPSYAPGSPSYAYVFVKPAGGWKNMTPTAVLAPSDTVDGYFGESVAVEGNTIVIGDIGYESNPGAVYVYVKPAGGWSDMTQTAKLTTSDGMLNDELGASVSISGTTIAAGAPQIVEFGLSGKAYVFVQPAGGWTNMTQTAELTVPTAVEGSDIGMSIFVNDAWVLAGAPSFGNDGFPGSAYIFSKPVSGWANTTASATLTPGDNQLAFTEFGDSVSGSGNIAIVGASRRGLPPFGAEGGIYVFKEPASGWQNAAGLTVLTGSDARSFAFLGASAAMSGNVVVGGAEGLYISSGAAYVFGLP